MILFIMRDEDGDWFEEQINKTFGKAIYEMVTMIRIGYTYTCHISPPIPTPRSQWSKLVLEVTAIPWEKYNPHIPRIPCFTKILEATAHLTSISRIGLETLGG
jgi:hypothetical protein